MLNPRKKFLLPEAQKTEPVMPHHTEQRAQHTTSLAILAPHSCNSNSNSLGNAGVNSCSNSSTSSDGDVRSSSTRR